MEKEFLTCNSCQKPLTTRKEAEKLDKIFDFCGKCGNKLIAPAYKAHEVCPNCKKPYAEKDDSYCAYCGRKR